MVDSAQIKLQITTGQLQRTFLLISDNIKKKNIFDNNILPIEYSDIFSFYLYLIKTNSDNEAFIKILEYLEWRERLLELSSPVNLDHLLGCNVNTIFKRMPECHFGYDKNRKPVVYYLFGKQDIQETLKIITRKQIFDYHLWQNDAINELCYHKTIESGSMISSCTLVMDVVGMTSNNVSTEFLHILNRRAEVNGRYFPYLFDRILIINAISTDTKMIRTLKDFCSVYSPRANVYVTGPERNPSDVLSKYIDIDQLPTEYGGLKGSIMNITHPYYDAITFRRIGGGVLPYRKGGVAYTTSPTAISTPNQKNTKSVSYTTTTIGTSPYDVEDDEIVPTQYSTSASTGGIEGGMDDISRTYSTASSRYIYPNMNSRFNNRSTSMTSTHGPFSLSKTEQLLSSVSMNPIARQTLILFLELFTGSSLPYPTLLIDNFQTINTQIDGTISNASTSPYSSNTSITLQSNNTSTYQQQQQQSQQSQQQQQPQQQSVGIFSRYTTTNQQRITAQLNTNNTINTNNNNLSTSPIISVSVNIKPGVFSLAIDGAQQSSVGAGLGQGTDMLCIRTKTGVVSFKASIPRPISNINQNDSTLYTSKKIVAKRYNGNLIISNGRIYCLTRGASMSGWLQKWPMRSQAAGSYTHRYFILEDNELRYWKVDPNSGKGLPGNRSSVSSSAPLSPPPDMHPKGGITLTPNTIIKRSKTLFGSSIIEIKSEYDSITLCAYNSVDDSAWFSELYHALERVKKVYRDENSNEQPFPEVVWRQQDPLCIAINADVIDTSSSEDYYRYRTSMISPPLTITPEMYRKNIPNNNGNNNNNSNNNNNNNNNSSNSNNNQISNHSLHSTDESPTVVLENDLNYVVLCRVNTGLSSLHSVQIGSYEHIPLRLENNDLDIGVKLISIKLCGDCLVVSGSNGFVGSGRMSQYSDNYLNSPSTTTSLVSNIPDSKRIYIRRFQSNFHGDDSVVQCLATPRYHVNDIDTNRGINSLGPFNYLETSVSILASGDDIGGLCVWRRDKGNSGPSYSVPQKNGSNSTVRYGYTWTCIHHAKVGHKISSLSFSNDGNYLAVSTFERTILFDLSTLLSSDPIPLHNPQSSILPLNSRSQQQPQSQNVYPQPYIIPFREVKTFVLDDCVGIVSEVIFSVDLSTNGIIKLWKIKQGTESVNSGNTNPNSNSNNNNNSNSNNNNLNHDDGTPNQLIRSESASSTLASDRLGMSSDRLYYTELPLSYVVTKNEIPSPVHRLFIQKDQMNSNNNNNNNNNNTNNSNGIDNIRITNNQSNDTLPAIISTINTSNNNNNNNNNNETDPTVFRVDSFGNRVPATLHSEQSSHHDGSSLSEQIVTEPLTENNPIFNEKSSNNNNNNTATNNTLNQSNINTTTTTTTTITTTITANNNISNGNVNRMNSIKIKETGWLVDPFSYADVCVIDPLRMHLRDWWCDYSSRFLLLGHSRIASLTNFEPISLSSHSSLSKNNPLRDDIIGPSSVSSTSSIISSSIQSTTGLDKKSTSMFWSTLTSSLGRRVIARYYVPLMYYEKKKQNLDLKFDCIKFILYISRCLFETLGDEYLNSLLIAWKAIAQDEIRNILEKYSSSWFRDVTTVNIEILRRFELSPNLALNCLDELIQSLTKASQDDNNNNNNNNNQFLSSYIPDNSPPLIELNNVLNMFINLKNSLTIICDEYGILHLVPSYIQRYLDIGIFPLQYDRRNTRSSSTTTTTTSSTTTGTTSATGATTINNNTTSNSTVFDNLYSINPSQWEDEDPIQLLYTLILEPLSYLERTEPFAVALTIVGLQGVPVYIYNNIMGRGNGADDLMTDINDGSITNQGGNNSEKTSAEKLLLSLQRNKMMSNNISNLNESNEKGIEGLISLMAKIMPPWIRFILTSDTDKVL